MTARPAGFEAVVSEAPRTVLFLERLRDGRIALGTRVRRGDGDWQPGELHVLDPHTFLALAGWLVTAVEDEWMDTVRARAADPLRTARELYGDGPGAVRELAYDLVTEIPPALMARALVSLANSIGPESRDRLVSRLNRTADASEDDGLRRRIEEENEAFAYVVAAAALFDSLERGVDDADEAADARARR